MSEKMTSNEPIDIPDDLKEEAAKIIKEAFQLFSDHTKRMTEDLAAFNQNQAEIKERLKSGVRRTTGRIV